MAYAEKGTLSVDNDSISSGTGQQWSLDALGNWSGDNSVTPLVGGLTEYTIADSMPGYQTNTDTLPSTIIHDTDATNQILSISKDGISTTLQSDAAGNVIFDGTQYFEYDAFNRVAAAYEESQNIRIATYEYDALGRRITKTVGVDTVTDPTDYFYYDGHRMIEHHQPDANDAVVLNKQFVYGINYIDEVIGYFDPDNDPAEPVFILQDANYNVIATMQHTTNFFDATKFVEQYSYVSLLLKSSGQMLT